MKMAKTMDTMGVRMDMVHHNALSLVMRCINVDVSTTLTTVEFAVALDDCRSAFVSPWSTPCTPKNTNPLIAHSTHKPMVHGATEEDVGGEHFNGFKHNRGELVCNKPYMIIYAPIAAETALSGHSTIVFKNTGKAISNQTSRAPNNQKRAPDNTPTLYEMFAKASRNRGGPVSFSPGFRTAATTPRSEST